MIKDNAKIERVTLTVQETADLLGIGLSTAYVKLEQNIIPNRRLGKGKYLIYREGILTWLASATPVQNKR